MTVHVERLPNEPILIATLSGDLTTEIVQEMFSQSAALMEKIEGRVYRITDIQSANIDFPDLIFVLSQSAKGHPGSPSDLRICGALVGKPEWAQFYADSLRQPQYGHLDIPIFEDFESAMTYMREQMAAA